MSAIYKGVVLALASLVATGLALGLVDPGHGRFEMLLIVLMVAWAPGIVAGMVLGAIAHASAGRSIRVRQLTLVIGALAGVVLITHSFGQLDLAPVSCIPTALAALVLERWTRRAAR
jgi:hypothetical protein